MTELLILIGTDLEKSQRELQKLLRIVQQSGSRAFVVEGEQPDIQLALQRGYAVKADEVNLDTLPYDERLAVRAWRERARDKDRFGENKNWGSDKFDAP